jgi:hypothetical protein
MFMYEITHGGYIYIQQIEKPMATGAGAAMFQAQGMHQTVSTRSGEKKARDVYYCKFQSKWFQRQSLQNRGKLIEFEM